MADLVNLDAVNAGLKSTKVLRGCVRDLFKSLAEGNSGLAQTAVNKDGSNENGTEEPEKAFLVDLQTAVNNINNRIRELESACTLLAHPSVPVSLGNSGLIGQDPSFERTPIYSTMVNTYRWSDRMVELAANAAQLLTQNALKRSQYSNTPGRGRMLPAMMRRVTYTPQQVDHICHNLQRLFHDMTIEVMRPFGAPTVLKITLERVLKAVIVLRGTAIEWVLVKGYSEDFVGDDRKLDIWTESRYQVFRKVTDHASAAMLNFYLPMHTDVALRSFVTWLHSYTSLFSKPCRKCDRRLLNNMPPTWRDFRNLDVYHEICRP